MKIPDLIITDLMMPIMDGMELTRLVKESPQYQEIPLLMLSARDEFAEYIDKIEFSKPEIPVIQNVNAEISDEVDQIRSNLIEQLSAPVMWTATMNKLVGLGVERVIECGPGAVLRGLAKRVSRDLSLDGLDSLADMEAFLSS